MECPEITNLKLDQDDQKALEEIRRVERAGNMLQVVMPAGVLAEIFLGNNAAQAAYNIHSTEWGQFARAMKTLPRLIRARIEQIAQMRIVRGGLS